jgi:CBS domain-containing protein
MSRYVEVVSHETDVRGAAVKMRDLRADVLPVCDGSRLVGIVTIRDIAVRLAAEGHDAMTTRVSEIMTRDPIFCFEDQEIARARGLLEDHQIDRLPVLDRNRQLVGIITSKAISEYRHQWSSSTAVADIAILPPAYAMMNRR